MRIWRISNHADLSGMGGLRAGGRWHHRGRPVVYCAENPAAALLEILVHMGAVHPDNLPDTYQLLEIEAGDAVSRIHLDLAMFPNDWLLHPTATRTIGSQWLAERSSALFTDTERHRAAHIEYLAQPHA